MDTWASVRSIVYVHLIRQYMDANCHPPRAIFAEYAINIQRMLERLHFQLSLVPQRTSREPDAACFVAAYAFEQHRHGTRADEIDLYTASLRGFVPHSRETLIFMMDVFRDLRRRAIKFEQAQEQE